MRKYSRRNFIKSTSFGLTGLTLSGSSCITNRNTTSILHENVPQTLLNSIGIKLKFSKERMIMPDGIQPFMMCTNRGTLLVQGTPIRQPVKPSSIGHLPYSMKTVISRDNGKKWKIHTFSNDYADPSFEGGMLQLRSGKILLLDTYILPDNELGKGKAVLYTSTDDLKTIQGPFNVSVNLPDADFYSSTDDGGNKNDAQRFHRRIIEMPNGDLLTTMYGHFKGDLTPVTYQPAMKKVRTTLLRSRNGGLHWEIVSHITDTNVGTEGYGEAVLVSLSKGQHKGRLICIMRTGENLYECISDDDGKTWSRPVARIFANLDVNKLELWGDMFKKIKRKEVVVDSKPEDLIGAIVNPELIELRSGLLIAGFGLRLPHHACFENPQHSWNGNYIAVSTDHGKTWGNVTRLTSGIPTTHYLSIEETPVNNELFVAYDYGSWGIAKKRYIYGRAVKISLS